MSAPFSTVVPGWPGEVGSLVGVSGDFDPGEEPTGTPTMQFDAEQNSQLLALLEDF